MNAAERESRLTFCNRSRSRHNHQVTYSLEDRLTAARSDADADAAVLVDLGCDLADAGEHLDAAWCFRAALDLGDEVAAFNLGNELAALGRDRDALLAYERALAAGEHDAWLNLGDVLERLGDLGGALRAYEQGQACGDVNAGLARAFLLRETGDPKAATDVMEQLAADGSGLADAVAACWLYDTTLDTSLEARLRAGADLCPGARSDLADILHRSGRLDEAVRVLQPGVDLGEPDSCLALGNIYADDLDNPTAAETAYRAGILAGDAHCHHNLAVLLQNEGRLGEARHHYTLAADAGDSLAQRALDQLDDD
jgi:tetratricopeptide (TPR) repeat protein